ncbi:hypothetical protein ACA910_008494 [Epithemia clementina (nom. ined.)]
MAIFPDPHQQQYQSPPHPHTQYYVQPATAPPYYAQQPYYPPSNTYGNAVGVAYENPNYYYQQQQQQQQLQRPSYPANYRGGNHKGNRYHPKPNNNYNNYNNHVSYNHHPQQVTPHCYNNNYNGNVQGYNNPNHPKNRYNSTRRPYGNSGSPQEHVPSYCPPSPPLRPRHDSFSSHGSSNSCHPPLLGISSSDDLSDVSSTASCSSSSLGLATTGASPPPSLSSLPPTTTVTASLWTESFSSQDPTWHASYNKNPQHYHRPRYNNDGGSSPLQLQLQQQQQLRRRFNNPSQPKKPFGKNQRRFNNKAVNTKLPTLQSRALTLPLHQQQHCLLSHPQQYLAMDCEMVGVGEHGARSALARVVLIDWHGKVVLDQYVRPREPVTDYRTFVSGITEADLTGEQVVDLDTCRTKVLQLLQYNQNQNETDHDNKNQKNDKKNHHNNNGKFLIGHALENDLQALGIVYPWYLIRDTAQWEPFMKVRETCYFPESTSSTTATTSESSTTNSNTTISSSSSPLHQHVACLGPRKLKELCREQLHRDIQTVGKPHCPIEDALAALDLYKLVRVSWEKAMQYELLYLTKVAAAAAAANSSSKRRGRGRGRGAAFVSTKQQQHPHPHPRKAATPPAVPGTNESVAPPTVSSQRQGNPSLELQPQEQTEYAQENDHDDVDDEEDDSSQLEGEEEEEEEEDDVDDEEDFSQLLEDDEEDNDYYYDAQEEEEVEEEYDEEGLQDPDYASAHDDDDDFSTPALLLEDAQG